MNAPSSALATTVTSPTAACELTPNVDTPTAAFCVAPEAREPAAEVASVKTLPKAVTATPAPDAARVMAEPPTCVITVNAFPPSAAVEWRKLERIQ